MKIIVIGSGNVATVLSRLAQRSGHEICQVYSRNQQHAFQLAEALNVSVAPSVEDISLNADLYLIAIKDDALEHISSWLHLKNQLVVHTAGSMPMKVLEKLSRNYGVVYPLQSLRKESEPLSIIPILVDGSNPEIILTLKTFAASISTTVAEANDAQRKKIHLAATISNNFTNYLYAMTEIYCRKEGVNFQLLLPIITETSKRLQHFPPEKMQTGPAIRNDQTTISAHLELLREYPELRNIYELFTKQIGDHYQ